MLVLIDLTVPRMGGLGLLGAIRAHPETRALPVVTLTRSDADPTVEPGSQLGANGHVVKPMSAGQFLTTAQAAVLSRPEAL